MGTTYVSVSFANMSVSAVTGGNSAAAVTTIGYVVLSWEMLLGST
jgi:hypothetical protein